MGVTAHVVMAALASLPNVAAHVMGVTSVKIGRRTLLRHFAYQGLRTRPYLLLLG